MERVIDGLDVQQEFDRLKTLVTWSGVDMSGVTLRVRHYNRILRKHGHADSRKNEVLVNTWASLSRFNIQETLVHELAHIYCDRRYNTREVHGPRFYHYLDRAFQEAYGPLIVAPRVRVGHGRYAAALRQQAQVQESMNQVARIDEVLAESAAVVPSTEDLLPTEARPTRGSVGWEHLPEPLKSMKEPARPLGFWLDGMNRESGERVGRPITVRPEPRRAEKVKPAVQDARVLAILGDRPTYGLTRAGVDRAYAQLHGPFPGKNTYNSIWRLKKAGKITNVGQRWYVI